MFRWGPARRHLSAHPFLSVTWLVFFPFSLLKKGDLSTVHCITICCVTQRVNILDAGSPLKPKKQRRPESHQLIMLSSELHLKLHRISVIITVRVVVAVAITILMIIKLMLTMMLTIQTIRLVIIATRTKITTTIIQNSNTNTIIIIIIVTTIIVITTIVITVATSQKS